MPPVSGVCAFLHVLIAEYMIISKEEEGRPAGVFRDKSLFFGLPCKNCGALFFVWYVDVLIHQFNDISVCGSHPQFFSFLHASHQCTEVMDGSAHRHLFNLFQVFIFSGIPEICGIKRRPLVIIGGLIITIDREVLFHPPAAFGGGIEYCSAVFIIPENGDGHCLFFFT